MTKEKNVARNWIPWGITAVFLAVLLLFSQLGWWQSVATGPQLQVPMFYDAHYLFPRPWTQAQAAPGVPEPFPVALYGLNVIRQPFVVATEEITAVSVWLAGDKQTAVTLTLSDGFGQSRSASTLLWQGAAGGWYQLEAPWARPADGLLHLSVAAPQATAEQPVIVRTVGGDWLGGSVFLNEFPRPGNLQLRVYGRNMLAAWQAQLLPPTFRTRLPQYKPLPLKPWFGGLLWLTLGLSLLFLLLAVPKKRPFLPLVGWLLASLLGGLLLWQVGGGRLLLWPRLIPTTVAEPQALPTTASTPRLLHDLALLLWTADRRPEPRAITTSVVAGLPLIEVPGEAELHFPLAIPPNGALVLGLLAEEPTRFSVWLNGRELWQATETAVGTPLWQTIDLAPWAGESGRLMLKTSGEAARAAWVQPQLVAQTSWVRADLPAAATAVAASFDQAVRLQGVAPPAGEVRAGEPLSLTLYWEALVSSVPRATVFVHLLDEGGEIVAQQDAPPLGDAYPTSVWQVGDVVEDVRVLALPPDLPAGRYRLGVGLYDSVTLRPWGAHTASGQAVPDNRVLLETAVVVTE